MYQCNCGWEGYEEDLALIEDTKMDELYGCPECGRPNLVSKKDVIVVGELQDSKDFLGKYEVVLDSQNPIESIVLDSIPDTTISRYDSIIVYNVEGSVEFSDIS